MQRTRHKSKEDKKCLEDFLKKMQVERTPEMEDAKLAELEAAYSTLNTLAYLSIPAPLLETQMKSVMIEKSTGGLKSKSLI